MFREKHSWCLVIPFLPLPWRSQHPWRRLRSLHSGRRLRTFLKSRTSSRSPARDAVRKRSKTSRLPISVVDGETLQDSGAFNVGRLQNLVPTLQFYSTNPRNTFVNIRGLGQPYGLTNDGIEPGVGFYVDGVLYTRPASTTMDFIDVERVEVLRGPQSTLFGKNTTAGAILVTTRKPSFTPRGQLRAELRRRQLHAGEGVRVAARSARRWRGAFRSPSTQRDGNLYNTTSKKHVNDLNNGGLRGQLLYTPSDDTDITFAIDYTRQRPDGYAAGPGRRRADLSRHSGIRVVALQHPGEPERESKAATSGASSTISTTPRRTSIARRARFVRSTA